MRGKWTADLATMAFMTGLAGTCLAVERFVGRAIIPGLANAGAKPKPSEGNEWRVGYVVPYRVPKAGSKNVTAASSQSNPQQQAKGVVPEEGGYTDAERVALMSL